VKLTEFSEKNNLPFPPLDIGGQDVLTLPEGFYGKPWWEDSKKTALKPYTESEPFKTEAWQ
jgi:hypothetical protein